MKSIFIITGDTGIGKTTFLIDVLAQLQINGFLVGGFVALHRIESDDYYIRNVETNQESLLMHRIAGFDKRPNHFKLYPEGLQKGNIWIKEILNKSLDIAILDEIGGFELAGELWFDGFTALVESVIPLIFTVKTKHLDQVMKKWNIKPSFIFDSTDFDNSQSAFERVIKLI